MWDVWGERKKERSLHLNLFWSTFSPFHLHELKIIITICIFKKEKLGSKQLCSHLPTKWFSCFTSWQLFQDPSSQRYISPHSNVWRKTNICLFSLQATQPMGTILHPAPAMALDPPIPTSSSTRWVKLFLCAKSEMLTPSHILFKCIWWLSASCICCWISSYLTSSKLYFSKLYFKQKNASGTDNWWISWSLLGSLFDKYFFSSCCRTEARERQLHFQWWWRKTFLQIVFLEPILPLARGNL